MAMANGIKLEFIAAQREVLAYEARGLRDENGIVDTAKVEDLTVRAAMQSLGGGARFAYDVFEQQLKAAYDMIDRADVGLLGSRLQPRSDAGCTGHERKVLNFLGLTRNLRIDTSERAAIGSNPLALHLLAFADARIEACESVLALGRYFGPGVQRLSSKADGTMSLLGDANSTQGLKTIIAKNLDTGKRFVAPINPDGSYELPVGASKLDQSFRVWFEPADGPTFVGGTVGFSASAKPGSSCNLIRGWRGHVFGKFPPDILTLLGLRESRNSEVSW